MASSLQKTITRAAALMLRPLLKLWLRFGLSHRAFEEVVRWVMVDIASKEFTLDGKKQSDSRISVITGLTRHQVKAYRNMELEDSPSKAKANRATRVLTGWITDTECLDKAGNPLPLNTLGKEPSFPALVQRHAGDVPYRAILDELIAMGTVTEKGDLATLQSHGHVPSGNDPEPFLEIMGHDASTLMETMVHNLDSKDDNTRFQKKVSYANLSEEQIRDFKKASSEEAQKLLEKWNLDLKSLQGKSKQSDQIKPRRIGWGLYFFDGEDKA